MTVKPIHRFGIIYLFVLLGAGMLLIHPLFKPGFFLSDDGEWMIIRLSAFFQSLRDGQIPVRFLGRLNHGYGYPVANFLYPGFLYVGSIIHALGFSFVDSIKILLAGSLLGSSVLTFFWLRIYFSSFASFIGGMSFLFAPYLVFDLYSRGSVGEIFALFPVTLTFYAVASSKYWLLAPAIGLLVLGHNTLALLFFPYIILYMVSRRQMYTLWQIVLGLGLAAFFWIPALIEKQYVRFDLVTVSKISDYFINNRSLILIGPVFLVACVVLLLSKRKFTDNVLHLLIFGCCLFMTLPVSEPLWHILSLGQFVQFPYRFLSVSLVAGSFLVAAATHRMSLRYKVVFFVFALVVWFTTTTPRINLISHVVREEGFYSTNEATTTVADEYMPRWVKKDPTERTNQKLLIRDGLGSVDITGINTRRIEGRVILQTQGRLQFNTVYYPGWGVLVDGIPIEIRKDNEMGLIQFNVPPGNHSVVIEFRETPLRLITDMMSLTSVLVWVIFLVRYIRNQTFKKNVLKKGK